jgi:hypothetical protein
VHGYEDEDVDVDVDCNEYVDGNRAVTSEM